MSYTIKTKRQKSETKFYEHLMIGEYGTTDHVTEKCMFHRQHNINWTRCAAKGRV